MADILPTLIGFPPDKKLSARDYDAGIHSFIKDVSKISNSSFNKTCDKKNILDLLDPAINSLAFCITFNRQIAAAGKDSQRINALIPYATTFLECFDPIQVRYKGMEWRQLFETVQSAMLQAQATDISPLVNGLLRLDPTAGTFTSNHIYILRAAMANGVPSQALPILDKTIYAYPQPSVKNLPDELPCLEHEFSNAFITEHSELSRSFRADTVLEYYLLGAMIYMGLRNNVRARLYLEHVLLYPSQGKTASALQVEAYKKWVLLGLLSDGKSFPYPKTAEPLAMKNIRAISIPYDSLASDFERRDIKKFTAEVQEAGHLWADDGNLRLVQETGFALLRFQVIDLQKTYDTLPVARVATILDMDAQNTLALLVEMISTGYILAELSHDSVDAVLKFKSSEAKLPESQDEENDLEAQTARIGQLIAAVREADRRLQLTKEFVEVVRRQKNSRDVLDPADAMDLTWDDTPGATGLPPPPGPILVEEEEEDLMQ